MNSNQIYVISYAFVVQLIVAEIIFLLPFDRRRLFPVRLIGMLVAVLAFRYLFSLLQSPLINALKDAMGGRNASNLFMFLQNTLLIVASVFAMWFCYKGSFFKVLSACTAAECAQHFGYKLNAIIFTFVKTQFPWSVVWETLICFAIYALIYVFLIRKYDVSAYRDNGGDVLLTILSFVIIIVCIGLNRFAGSPWQKNTAVALALYAMCFCAFAVLVRYAVFARNYAKTQVEIDSLVLKEQAKQYEQWKASLEQINIKYHDLKHELNALKEQNAQGNFTTIEKMLSDYGSVVRTGNEMLDVLISSKKMVCENNGIVFSCMVDGEALKCFDTSLIYSLFCNALDNAIESSTLLENHEKRVISLNVKTLGNMVSIHLQNYYDGEIAFEDGIPVPTGKDSTHGYGMKSMSAVATKLGGEMSVSTENGVFRLGFVLPIKQ